MASPNNPFVKNTTSNPSGNPSQDSKPLNLGLGKLFLGPSFYPTNTSSNNKQQPNKNLFPTQPTVGSVKQNAQSQKQDNNNSQQTMFSQGLFKNPSGLSFLKKPQVQAQNKNKTGLFGNSSQDSKPFNLSSGSLFSGPSFFPNAASINKQQSNKKLFETKQTAGSVFGVHQTSKLEKQNNNNKKEGFLQNTKIKIPNLFQKTQIQTKKNIETLGNQPKKAQFNLFGSNTTPGSFFQSSSIPKVPWNKTSNESSLPLFGSKNNTQQSSSVFNTAKNQKQKQINPNMNLKTNNLSPFQSKQIPKIPWKVDQKNTTQSASSPFNTIKIQPPKISLQTQNSKQTIKRQIKPQTSVTTGSILNSNNINSNNNKKFGQSSPYIGFEIGKNFKNTSSTPSANPFQTQPKKEENLQNQEIKKQEKGQQNSLSAYINSARQQQLIRKRNKKKTELIEALKNQKRSVTLQNQRKVVENLILNRIKDEKRRNQQMKNRKKQLQVEISKIQKQIQKYPIQQSDLIIPQLKFQQKPPSINKQQFQKIFFEKIPPNQLIKKSQQVKQLQKQLQELNQVVKSLEDQCQKQQQRIGKKVKQLENIHMEQINIFDEEDQFKRYYQNVLKRNRKRLEQVYKVLNKQIKQYKIVIKNRISLIK